MQPVLGLGVGVECSAYHTVLKPAFRTSKSRKYTCSVGVLASQGGRLYSKLHLLSSSLIFHNTTSLSQPLSIYFFDFQEIYHLENVGLWSLCLIPIFKDKTDGHLWRKRTAIIVMLPSFRGTIVDTLVTGTISGSWSGKTHTSCPQGVEIQALFIWFRKTTKANNLGFFTDMQARVVKKQTLSSDSTGLLTLQAQKTLS